MTALIMGLQLILGLSLLVFIHEMGHYLAARAFGIRVTKFYLFFDAWGVKLFKFKWKGTEFGMGWLPFGGYCQIAGMIDETQSAKDLSAKPEPWEYRSKPAWQRLIVLFGGIFLNFLTGVFILSMLLFRSSAGYLSNDDVSKYGITPSPVAKEIGFQDGDKILNINGKKIKRFQDAQAINVLFGANVTVLREGDTVHIAIPKNTYKQVMQDRTQFFGSENFPVIIDSTLEGSIAQQMGLLANDRILQINADTVHSFGSLQGILNAYRNEDVRCLVSRNAEVVALTGTLDSTGRLGVYIHRPYEATHYTFGSAFAYGYKDAMDLLTANVKGIGKLFTGEEKATESLQGPIGIAQIYGAQWIWSKFWYVTGLISLILAFMNFLPIPALDGGHIIFTLWEIITRKKPSDKFLTVAQNVGMALLLALMVFAFGNDLFKVFK